MKTKITLYFFLAVFILLSCGRNKPSGLYEFVSKDGEVKSFNFISDSSVIISSSESGLALTIKYRIEKNFVIMNVPQLGETPVEITNSGIKTTIGELYVKKTSSSAPTITSSPQKQNVNSDTTKQETSTASSNNNLISKTYSLTKANDKIGAEELTVTLAFITSSSVRIMKTNQLKTIYEDQTLTYRIEGNYVIVTYPNKVQQSLEIVENGEGLKGTDGLIYTKED